MEEKFLIEFLEKLQELCFEYHCEIAPTIKGWTGDRTKNFAVIGIKESIELLYIDEDNYCISSIIKSDS